MTLGLIRSYSIQNDREFGAQIDQALNQVSDLSFAFGEIARDWRKSNAAQFSLKGSGQYPPLDPDYAIRKRRLAGRAVPILVGARQGGASGRLRDSLTGPVNSDAIVQVGKTSLLLGTKVAYGVYHQSDAPRSRLPLRKFLFIGPEAPRSAPSEITGRLERWIKILEAETARKLKKA